MKFGKQLLFHIIPEWSGKYFDYKTLKLKLKAFKKKKKSKIPSHPKGLRNKGIMKIRLLECAVSNVKRSVTRHDWKQQPIQSRTQVHCYETKITDKEIDELHAFIGTIDSASTVADPQEGINVEENEENLEECLSPVEEDLNEWVRDYKESIDKVNDFFLETFYRLKERLENTISGFQVHCLSDDEGGDQEEEKKAINRSISQSSTSFNGRPSSSRKHHRHGAQKDRLEYATSWTRAFYDIYEEITWLESYCRINRIATTKILKKFCKVFFDRQTNKLVSYLYERTDEQCFVASLEPKVLKSQLVQFFRFYFTNGDKEAAKKELERNPVVNLRKKDVIPIAFFAGLSLGFFLLLLVIIFTPLQGSKFTIQDTYASLPAYRFSLMFILVALSAGVLISVYRHYRVNYVLIFEIDMNYRIREAQLFKIFTLLFCLWLFCAVGQISMFKLDLFAGFTMSIFSFILFIFMLITFINPFRCCQRTIRFSIWKTLGHAAIAPFGLVRFRHFFLADVLTSLVKPLTDIRYCFCYFIGTQAWLNDNRNQCMTQNSSLSLYFNLFLTLFPYWMRFAQCLHKYYETNVVNHLFNALKYFLSLLIPVISLAYHYDPSYFYLFLLISGIGASYSFMWDIYMDWGLLRSWSPKHFGLRKKTLYARKAYYIAVVIDLFLRFAWLVSLYPAQLLSQYWGVYFQIFLMDLLEWGRRSIWAAFRVQNENINNLERYRAECDIPLLPLDEDMDVIEKKIEEKNKKKEGENKIWPKIKITPSDFQPQ